MTILRFGLRWLEPHVSPTLAAIIELILKIMGASKDQGATAVALHEHISKFKDPAPKAV
jgi:hypothetical protein